MIADEYWYSEELHISLLAKHSDPRTGELTVRVTQLNRNEPAVRLFEVPPSYKLVDMTPPEQNRGIFVARQDSPPSAVNNLPETPALGPS